MKKNILTLLFCLLGMAAWAQEFWLGADISGTSELERRGVKLYNQAGEERDNITLMRELGLNAARFRVWVNPKDGLCDMHDVLAMARRAQDQGMAIMIDFHYSDWWADPGKQNIPAKWKNYNYRQMKRALARHTTRTLKLLKAGGIDVKWIQIGNETTNGFLWPMAHTPENMRQYAGLTPRQAIAPPSGCTPTPPASSTSTLPATSTATTPSLTASRNTMRNMT